MLQHRRAHCNNVPEKLTQMPPKKLGPLSNEVKCGRADNTGYPGVLATSSTAAAGLTSVSFVCAFIVLWLSQMLPKMLLLPPPSRFDCFYVLIRIIEVGRRQGRQLHVVCVACGKLHWKPFVWPTLGCISHRKCFVFCLPNFCKSNFMLLVGQLTAFRTSKQPYLARNKLDRVHVVTAWVV